VLAIDYLQRRETLLDDTVNFAEKARAAGVEVEVAIFDDMISRLADVRG
jgi:acetyl esterase/lipase